MARQVNVLFVDDLDGSEAHGTLAFGLDGKTFEIDLSEKNAATLRDLFAPYVKAARRTGAAGRAPRRAAVSAAGDRERNQAIREWAESQGMTVAARGRISAEIVEAYESRAKAPVASTHTPEDAPKKRAEVYAPEFSSR